jgi:hypothetical protein
MVTAQPLFDRLRMPSSALVRTVYKRGSYETHSSTCPFLLSLAAFLAITSLSVLVLREYRLLFAGLWLFALIVLAATVLRTYHRPHSFDWPSVWDRYFFIPRFVILVSLATIIFKASIPHRVAAAAALMLLVTLRYNPQALPPHNAWLKESMPKKPWQEGARKIDRGEAVDILINPDWTLRYQPRSR